MPTALNQLPETCMQQLIFAVEQKTADRFHLRLLDASGQKLLGEREDAARSNSACSLPVGISLSWESVQRSQVVDIPS
jgi:hypothetical protein